MNHIIIFLISEGEKEKEAGSEGGREKRKENRSIFTFGLLRIRKYDRTFNDLAALMANVNTVLLPSKYAYSGGVSFAIHETVFQFFKTQPSPASSAGITGSRNLVYPLIKQAEWAFYCLHTYH